LLCCTSVGLGCSFIGGIVLATWWSDEALLAFFSLARSTLSVPHAARWHDRFHKPRSKPTKNCHEPRSTFLHNPCTTTGPPFFAKTCRFLSQVNEDKAGQCDTNRDEGYHKPGVIFLAPALL
jgi:hypothetical protein